MTESKSSRSLFLPIAVALVTGSFAAIPGILSFINTPAQIQAELSKVQLESEMQIELQRDRIVADFLSRLDDPVLHVRSGAALSLSALGGDTVVPVLVGKLREAIVESYVMEQEGGRSSELNENRQFVNALKQSLFAIGAPALDDLLDLNRDLTPDMKQAFRTRVKPGETIADLSEEQQEVAFSKLIELTRTAQDIKDIIRAILFKEANLGVAPVGEPSPLIEAGISLAYADLSKLGLIRINLSGVDLSFADLRGAQLEESYFENAQLKGALLQDSMFLEGVFDNTNFSGAKIITPSPHYSKSSFKGADFAGAQLEDGKFAEYLRQAGAINVPTVTSTTVPRQ